MIESWFIDYSLKGKGIDMKVRCICDNAPGVTKGKIYNAIGDDGLGRYEIEENDGLGRYEIEENDEGGSAWLFKSRFEVVEEMEIKAGNKYVDHRNEVCEVVFVGNSQIVAKWIAIDAEFPMSVKNFKDYFKPYIPVRTVWLNVYRKSAISHNTKESADASIISGLLYQQEVILQNPDEVK